MDIKPSPVRFQARTKFVQDYGRLFCRDAGLFACISEQRGFDCRCRNPRCSFECKRAWSEKESALDEYLLSKLPTECQVYRGSLKLPKDANADDHKQAKARFSRQINLARKSGAVIEFKAYAHDTDPYNRHWDYLLYSDLAEGTINEVVQAAAGKAGCTASCVPVGKAEVHRWAVYVTKLNRQPGRVPGEYVFLPAEDGSCLIWDSKGWYGKLGYKQQTLLVDGKVKKVKAKDVLWLELRQQWAQSPKKISNISTTPAEAVRRQLVKVLPERADEACSLFKLAWHIRWPNGVASRLRLLADLLAEMSNVKEENGVYYLLDFRQMPHAKKLFGSKPIPYHAEHWPLPPDPDKLPAAQSPKKISNFSTADDLELADEDFIRQLAELVPDGAARTA